MKRYYFPRKSLSLPGVLIGVALLFAISASAQSPSIEGTYQFISRQLSDGTMLKPPDIMGICTYSKSHRTFNTVRRDASGEFASTSLVSTYKLTTIEYSSRSFVPCRLGTDRCDFTNRSRNAEWLLPARLAHWPEPPRRSLDRTDTGRSALVAGTGLHAPIQP